MNFMRILLGKATIKSMLSLDEMSERVGRDRLGPDPTQPPY
jgi:hypothetical protein